MKFGVLEQWLLIGFVVGLLCGMVFGFWFVIGMMFGAGWLFLTEKVVETGKLPWNWE